MYARHPSTFKKKRADMTPLTWNRSAVSCRRMRRASRRGSRRLAEAAVWRPCAVGTCTQPPCDSSGCPCSLASYTRVHSTSALWPEPSPPGSSRLSIKPALAHINIYIHSYTCSTCRRRYMSHSIMHTTHHSWSWRYKDCKSTYYM